MIHTRLNVCSREPQLLCSIDPISLTGLALAAGGAGLGGIASTFAGGGSSGAAPAPKAPDPMAPPAAAPQGSKKQNAPAQPSFIGGTPTAPAQSGQKTLLGQ